MSWTLPRLIGITRANDLLLSGRVFTGEETRDWGLWNGVADDGAGALRIAQEWAHNVSVAAGPNAVSITKAQIYRDYVRHSLGASIDESIALIDDATKTAEYREGVNALREERPPQF
jgi:enoyl-CoA hydratase/carnithine racemase